MENKFYVAQHKERPETYLQYVRFFNGRIILMEITNNIYDSCYVDAMFFKAATPEEQVREELDLYGFELVEHPVWDHTNWKDYAKNRKKIREKYEYQR